MQSETLQGKVVRGEHIDQEQFVRLGNSLTRALNALKSRRKPKADTRPLHERLADLRSVKAATAPQASAGMHIADAPISRISAARRQAGDALNDEEESDA
jgi:hypothetical protein